MKREKENQVILAKRRTWMISFSFGQLSFPLQYRSLRFSSISNNFSFRDSLKDFFCTFFRASYFKCIFKCRCFHRKRNKSSEVTDHFGIALTVHKKIAEQAPTPPLLRGCSQANKKTAGARTFKAILILSPQICSFSSTVRTAVSKVCTLIPYCPQRNVSKRLHSEENCFKSLRLNATDERGRLIGNEGFRHDC